MHWLPLLPGNQIKKGPSCPGCTFSKTSWDELPVLLTHTLNLFASCSYCSGPKWGFHRRGYSCGNQFSIPRKKGRWRPSQPGMALRLPLSVGICIIGYAEIIGESCLDKRLHTGYYMRVRFAGLPFKHGPKRCHMCRK